MANQIVVTSFNIENRNKMMKMNRISNKEGFVAPLLLIKWGSKNKISSDPVRAGLGLAELPDQRLIRNPFCGEKVEFPDF